MFLRPYRRGEDGPLIVSWVTDKRTCALWCAGRFPWPLSPESFEERLGDLVSRNGDVPFVALDGEGEPVGFFCWSPGPAEGEGFLKFVLVDPEKRGKGHGRELVSLAAETASGTWGVGIVRLSVFTGNPAARRCYEKAGFVTESVEPDAFFFHGEAWGRCRMYLRL